MTLLAHEIRFDLLALWRNPRARVFTLLLPLILLVALVGLSHGGGDTTTVSGQDVALDRFFVGGIIAMSLLTACYGSLVAIVVSQRESGVFKRRRATPVPAWVVVAAQAITTLVMAVATEIVLLLVARVAYGIGIPAKGLAIAAVAIAFGGLAFACVAYAVASVIPNVEAAQPAVQLTMLPLYFISGIWFSTDDLPDWLRGVAEVFPVEPLSHAVHLAFLNGTLDGSDVATLAGWAVAGIVVAARRFSWLPTPARA
jgi:ABC-2 type transport system permease protein